MSAASTPTASWARRSAPASPSSASNSRSTRASIDPEMALLSPWPSERRPLRDPVTRTRIEQLTAFPANHWHLSAPDTPLTPAGDYLLFTSDRTGGPPPDLFRLEMRTGAIEQVTG